MCVSVEADSQRLVLHHGELADKHGGGGRLHQVAVALADGGRGLGHGDGGLGVERGAGRRQVLGRPAHVVHQAAVLQLRQPLAATVPLMGGEASRG